MPKEERVRESLRVRGRVELAEMFVDARTCLMYLYWLLFHGHVFLTLVRVALL